MIPAERRTFYLNSLQQLVNTFQNTWVQRGRFKGPANNSCTNNCFFKHPSRHDLESSSCASRQMPCVDTHVV
eukprot:5744210-Amphidinium_carterae.2